MLIRELLQSKPLTFSCELFPPKAGADLARADEVVETRPQDACFQHADALVREIRTHGGFCVGGACYPEGHVESASQEEDIAYLKQKVEAGCDFLTTQMFFDNNVLYRFLYKLYAKGIAIPVLAGIMPCLLYTSPSPRD